MKKISAVSFWMLFLALFCAFFMFLLKTDYISYAGDYLEYYGMTRSILNHGNVNLNRQDEVDLLTELGKPPDFFGNTALAYYPRGLDGDRYSSHFFFYSLLTVPIMFILKTLDLPLARSFPLVNLITLFATLAFICSQYVHTLQKRLFLVLGILISPLVWFITWPGPEIMYVSLLLLSVVLYSQKKLFWATASAIFASWQSQPFVFIALPFLAMYFVSLIHGNKLSYTNIIRLLFLCVLTITPNLYYMHIFGTLTPFAVTGIVGSTHFSFQKIAEIFIDPNIGLLVYFPVIFLFGIYTIVRKSSKNDLVIISSFLLPLIFFPSINNWNHGTAGYGPTRYALYFIPLLIWMLLVKLGNKAVLFLLLMALVPQLYVLNLNNYLTPNGGNSFKHTPYAQFLLNTYPYLYNPTPEIFIERTNGTEDFKPNPPIYTYNGKCTKTYLNHTQVAYVEANCGKKINSQNIPSIDDTPSSAYRTITVNEATFWPNDQSCDTTFLTSESRPYICMRNEQDILLYSNLDPHRVLPVPGTIGAWKLSYGPLQKLTIPPGYTVEATIADGAYVEF